MYQESPDTMTFSNVWGCGDLYNKNTYVLSYTTEHLHTTPANSLILSDILHLVSTCDWNLLYLNRQTKYMTDVA